MNLNESSYDTFKRLTKRVLRVAKRKLIRSTPVKVAQPPAK